MGALFLSPPFTTDAEIRSCFSKFELLPSGYHFDVMDGEFVAATHISVETINRVRSFSDLPFWVHLMAQDPAPLVEELNLHPGDTVSFHYEVFQKKEAIEALAERIEHKNLRPSLAINPRTDIERISYLLHFIEHVLVMSVQPGAAGQPFIPKTFDKLKELEMYRLAQELELIIAVDGGINASNIGELGALGVNEVALTSAIFSSKNPVQKLKELQNLFT